MNMEGMEVYFFMLCSHNTTTSTPQPRGRALFMSERLQNGQKDTFSWDPPTMTPLILFTVSSRPESVEKYYIYGFQWMGPQVKYFALRIRSAEEPLIYLVCGFRYIKGSLKYPARSFRW